ncbi:ribosomal protein L13 [Neorickettsia helminthoeca str. Oregon]|uniref:Large ribosomal subunit protein uL13 n=1 Tax=Neorickettsia helminthoeca str. Oregon TaxID=1286528 RepID=X5HMM0_9RICK|nr:50S ribosomal protein L13 [Neorickettsia helminthoeca]AHX11725.1 ribosomal protein L13 [Neorickettsia helminthoeca str. Oregon]
MSTSFLKQGQADKKWVVIDATDAVVGRLAAFVSTVLRGKTKVAYTPHMDCGDNVIILNASKVKFSGTKMLNKVYYRHTGYPGGLKSTTPRKLLDGKKPCEVVRLAVKRMLDDGPMARRRFKNLYVYAGPEHKHEAQNPQVVDFASMNRKNKR